MPANLYAKSETVRNVGNAIYQFLRNTLKLHINREKSGIREPVNFEILGFKFVSSYIKSVRGQYKLVASDKRWKL